MQYWQRKLQRSVTESRRSRMSRPWPSRRGSHAITLKATVAGMRARAAGLLALLAAGCGGGGPSDADRVRDVVDGYARALTRHDARALCSRLLAPDLVAAAERASGQPCARALRGLATSGAPRARIGAVRVDGDTATARLGPETLTLVRTPAGWRLASLGNDGGPIRRRP